VTSFSSPAREASELELIVDQAKNTVAGRNFVYPHLTLLGLSSAVSFKLSIINGSFASSILSLCQNDSSCKKKIQGKIYLISLQVLILANQTRFHLKRSA